MALNDDLLELLVGRGVDLNRFSASAQRDILAELQRLDLRLRAELVRWDPQAPGRTVFKRLRMEQLEREVRRILDEEVGPGGRAAKALSGIIRDLAGQQVDGAVEAMNRALGFDLFSMTVTGSQLRALAGDLMIQGSPAADWWAGIEDSTRLRFMSEVRMSVLRGETVEQTVRAVLPMEREGGGALAETRAQARSLVRTAIQTVNNAAHLEAFKANADVLKGIQWVSTLDNRTTPTCRGLDGLQWDLDFKPIGHDIPFPGPTAHWGCRSTQVPVTKSWDDLAKEFGLRTRIGRDLRDVATVRRASMDGQVSGRLTYQEWLEKQPKARQLDILGPGRYELWTKGKLDLADMLDFSGRPLTLDELRAR